ncbi:unnamed protein product, partial [Echinostoma caproni]|uniref:Reverse transcriptase domain-containing protein n=1 Tax=Echinostoma caproni TaxID=27848 RepID=A0A183BH19_9TREM
MLLHTSSLLNVHTRLQRLIVQCSNNTGGMKVRLAKLEVEGEPVFLKRRVIPYGQREDVLKALEKMERDGILTRVTSSAWATPIVIAMKSDGGMKVRPAKLEVEGEPVFLKRRVIPYGQREGVLKALEKMEHDGILTRVTSSAWATPIVIAMKSDGKTPRICGDYRLTLNPRLRKCATTTMEPEDFMKALHGSTYFSKIDLADAYLQIPLDPACRQFTTINTPWGLYQYNFLPFGLHTSSGIFQAAIDEVIHGLDGVLAYQDDIIVFGATKAEHDDRLTNLLERFAQKNVSIRASKCMFSSP